MWMHSWKASFKFRVPTVLLLTTSLTGCATGRYTPLGEAGKDEIEQFKENVYRVAYQVSAFTSQEQLDLYYVDVARS